MLTVKEAAARLGVSESAVLQHIRRGNLQAVKFGRDWAITEQEIKRFVDSRRSPGRPKS